MNLVSISGHVKIIADTRSIAGSKDVMVSSIPDINRIKLTATLG